MHRCFNFRYVNLLFKKLQSGKEMSDHCHPARLVIIIRVGVIAGHIDTDSLLV